MWGLLKVYSSIPPKIIIKISVGGLSFFRSCQGTPQQQNFKKTGTPTVFSAQILQNTDSHSHKFQVVPDFLQQVIKVPPVMSRDWDAVGHLIDNVELFNGDLVNFVQHINARDINPTKSREGLW